MAGTRRSTRQPTSTVPKYTEDSSSHSEDDAPKRNGKKATTRRKRARVEDEDVKDEEPPPPKKAATSASKSKSKPKPKPKPATKPSKPTAAETTPSTTNRDASGNQQTYWLLKAEPLARYEKGEKVNDAFSIDDLAARTTPEPWTGVRNFQARNNMVAMRKGDLGFFYHSNAKPSGVVGILRIAQEAVVDETAFDEKDLEFDPKSDREKPKWFCVGVEFVKKFEGVVDLATIKGHAAKGGPLEGMQLVTNGRLSVSRVTKEEWKFILGLAEGGENENGDEKQEEGEEAAVDGK